MCVSPAPKKEQWTNTCVIFVKWGYKNQGCKTLFYFLNNKNKDAEETYEICCRLTTINYFLLQVPLIETLYIISSLFLASANWDMCIRLLGRRHDLPGYSEESLQLSRETNECKLEQYLVLKYQYISQSSEIKFVIFFVKTLSITCPAIISKTPAAS